MAAGTLRLQLSPSLVATPGCLPALFARCSPPNELLVSLLHNVPIAGIGETRNPYREWIGALIRADVSAGLFRASPVPPHNWSMRMPHFPIGERDLRRHVGGGLGHPPAWRLPFRRRSNSRWIMFPPAPGWPRRCAAFMISTGMGVPGRRPSRSSERASGTTAGCTRSTMLA